MDEKTSQADQVRIALLGVTDVLGPFREWLAGNVVYYQGQGYTSEQARAMAAAEYLYLLHTAVHPAE